MSSMVDNLVKMLFMMQTLVKSGVGENSKCTN